MSSRDYPRMMFHRTREPVVVQSRVEEDALGPDWSRIIWPVSAMPEPEPAARPEPEKPKEPEPDQPPALPEPEEEPAPATSLQRLARALKPPSRKKKRG